MSNEPTIRKNSSPNVRVHAAHTVAQMVMDIVSKIERGDWPAGHKLPTERELETRFSLSRNTLRKGLKILESKGLITRRIGSGSFVAGAEPPVMPDANRLSGALGASPSEVVEARLLIEPWAAASAARRASAADIQQLRECLDAGEQAQNQNKFEHWDGQLHSALVAAAKNEVLTGLQSVIDAVRLQPEWVASKNRAAAAENRRIFEAQHRAIVNAISSRDPDGARTAMEEHLLSVRRVLLGE